MRDPRSDRKLFAQLVFRWGALESVELSVRSINLFCAEEWRV